jgi:hypothetical protein
MAKLADAADLKADADNVVSASKSVRYAEDGQAQRIILV